MVLVKENIKEAITMLENLLMNCVENETVVCIHGNVNDFTVRYSSILNEFQIEQDEFCLTCGWFELDVRKNITEISYDEEWGSVHIVFEEGELYLDIEKDIDLE